MEGENKEGEGRRSMGKEEHQLEPTRTPTSRHQRARSPRGGMTARAAEASVADTVGEGRDGTPRSADSVRWASPPLVARLLSRTRRFAVAV